MKDDGSQAVSSEERYHKELSAQKKLVQLHKEAYEEQESKTRDAAKLIDELREKASTVGKQHQAQLEQLRIQLQKQLQDAQGVASAKITELQTQVSNAGSGKAIETSAAAAARLMESGVSVTEMYDRAVAAEKKSSELDGDKQKLEVYLKQILREIEEKAPVIAGQRLDYERALASHDELSRRLDQATRDNNQAECDKDELLRENTKLVRDNDSLKKEVGDLARQVQGLLRGQLSGGPGGASPYRSPGAAHMSGFAPATPAKSPFAKSSNPPGSAMAAAQGGMVTAQAVISENLVTFNDIPQLQARNQQLLKVVRRLSEAKEDQLESKVNDTENALALEAALKELENMRSARLRQEEMVHAIIKQRDMYRSLLQQANSDFSKQTAGGSPQKLLLAGSGGSGSSTPGGAPTTPGAGAIVITGDATPGCSGQGDASEALAASEKRIGEMENQLKMFTAERTETERILKEDLEKTRSLLNTERIQASKSLVGSYKKIVHERKETHSLFVILLCMNLIYIGGREVPY